MVSTIIGAVAMISTIIGAIAGSFVIGSTLAIVALEIAARRRWRRDIDTMNHMSTERARRLNSLLHPQELDQ